MKDKISEKIEELKKEIEAELSTFNQLGAEIGSILTRWLEYKKEQDEKVEKLKEALGELWALHDEENNWFNLWNCKQEIDKIFKNQGEENETRTN